MGNGDPFNDLYQQLIRMQRISGGRMHVPYHGAVDLGSKNPFSEGQRVVLIKGVGENTDPECNPHWGKDGNYIAGKVTDTGFDSVTIHFDHGKDNEFDLDRCKVVALEDAPEPKKKKNLKLNTTLLDALVIDEKKRDEIFAVLKQHQNSDKIFNEWGLGDVLEYGKGMTFMFYGPPGTGKTWGANCIAKALGMELLVISAAEIQSSEPGGANRAIQNAFAEAKAKNKVLFIDECDSLIQNRADLGMILSSEVNTLLTEIEKAEGVVILATNQIESMDKALERRISLILEFPMPKFDERMKIWTKLVPKKMPLAADVKLEELAKHELSGGQIKNVILQAARLAVSRDLKEVTLVEFNDAVKRLLESTGLMGSKSNYRQGGGVGVGVQNGQVSKFLETNLQDEKGSSSI
jgi:AAA+ superfamily predicted ATPase